MNDVQIMEMKAGRILAVEAWKATVEDFVKFAPPGSEIHWFDKINGKTVIKCGTVHVYCADYRVWVRRYPSGALLSVPLDHLIQSLASEADWTACREKQS